MAMPTIAQGAIVSKVARFIPSTVKSTSPLDISDFDSCQGVLRYLTIALGSNRTENSCFGVENWLEQLV
jgi:hypothetical protein